MTKARIAIIWTRNSEWRSCQVISENLSRAYRQALGKKARFFSCGDWKTPLDIARTAVRIHRFKPDRIVFLDHTPHPSALLNPLSELYAKDESFPALDFHVYGDFTRNTREWAQTESVLRGKRTRFICASPNQARLISGFLRRSRGIVSCVPFPVDARTYFVDPRAGRRWRKKLGLRPQDLLVAYAGRISSQKNCLRLAREILCFAKAEGKCRSVALVLAGKPDDIGEPFFGIQQRPGNTRRQWAGFLASLRPEERGMIRLLGSLEPAELRGLYNAADLFCSLSLYHDEDFGMSPAEALLCGTPSVLTRWGGFSGFQSRACRLVRVRWSRSGAQFSSAEVQRALSAMSRASQRKPKRITQAAARLSIESVSRSLRVLDRCPEREFPGFSPLLARHVQAQLSRPLFKSKASPFYRKLYSVYLR